MKPDMLIEKAIWGELPENDWPLVAKRLEAAVNGELQGNLWFLIHALGRAQKVEYRSLIESFLHNPHFPYAANAAMEVLCHEWGLCEEYLDEIKFFIKDPDHLYTGDLLHVRIKSVKLARHFLRNYFDPEIIKLLIEIIENWEEFPVRYHAGASLALPLGYDWRDLYAFQHEKHENHQVLDTEKYGEELAILVTKGINRITESSATTVRLDTMLLPSPQMRGLPNLVHESIRGHLTSEEITYVVDRLKKPDEEEESDLYQLLWILEYSHRWEYRKLIEQFLHFPHWVSATALQALCDRWGLAYDYLDEIKAFIKQKERDFFPAQMAAMQLAGQYLKYNEDAELSALLIEVMLDDSRIMERPCAYNALSYALGKSCEESASCDWDDETRKTNFLNLAEMARAHYDIKNGPV